MSDPIQALPPVPHKVRMTNEAGYISDPWGKFFRQLFSRVGGAIALSNLQLQTIQAGEIGTIITELADHESRVSLLETTVSAFSGVDFNQGPIL